MPWLGWKDIHHGLFCQKSREGQKKYRHIRGIQSTFDSTHISAISEKADLLSLLSDGGKGGLFVLKTICMRSCKCLKNFKISCEHLHPLLCNMPFFNYFLELQKEQKGNETDKNIQRMLRHLTKSSLSRKTELLGSKVKTIHEKKLINTYKVYIVGFIQMTVEPFSLVSMSWVSGAAGQMTVQRLPLESSAL